VKINLQTSNPTSPEVIAKIMSHADGIEDAKIHFKTWDDRDYTGDLNQHMVEITVEVPE